MRRTSIALCMAIAIVLGSPVVFAETSGDSSPAKQRQRATAKTEMIRSVAEVVAIDMAIRTMTLKRDDGNMLTVVAGPAVKNLAQIQVGDFVVAQYGRALAISLKQAPGPRSNTEAENGGTATLGAKPAASGQRKRVIVADIIAIDDKKGLATLKGSKETVVDVKVEDRKMLAAVRVGDQVELTYTEAVAISIKPAKTRR